MGIQKIGLDHQTHDFVDYCFSCLLFSFDNLSIQKSKEDNIVINALITLM